MLKLELLMGICEEHGVKLFRSEAAKGAEGGMISLAS